MDPYLGSKNSELFTVLMIAYNIFNNPKYFGDYKKENEGKNRTREQWYQWCLHNQTGRV